MSLLDALAMPYAYEYRARAAALREQARLVEDRALAAEWMRLAEGYIRLADEADRNAMTDLVYEPPPPKLDENTQL